MKLTSDQISIILTSTIDVRGISNMERADTKTRLEDYHLALTKWLENPWVHNIIFVENSGYSLDSLKDLVNSHENRKAVEFLSFDGQNFPRSLGKGYGETLALQHILEHSKQLQATRRFLKVNGRYYVPNLLEVLREMAPETSVFCNLTKSLSYADSRVFGGDIEFLAYVCRQGLTVDDSRGFWFEHALSKAALLAIADGMTWRFICRRPIIEGMSGTMNRAYTEPLFKRYVKGFVYAMTQRLLSL